MARAHQQTHRRVLKPIQREGDNACCRCAYSNERRRGGE